MEAVKNVLIGKNPKATFVLATAVVGAKVWYNSKYPVTGEETEEEKKQALMKLAAVIGIVLLLVLPVVYQQMKPKSPSSSFEKRVVSAASEIRDNISGDDFHSRVTEAARKLREEINSKTDLPSSSAAVASSSSLVAEAASEIEKFISCLLYTSPSPRDLSTSRMPSSA